MTLRDQIEARTNAANEKREREKREREGEREREREREIITSTKHLQRETAQRCFSCLRWEEEGVVVAGYCDDWNRKMGLKLLVNKLQNVIFSKIRLNGMYSKRTARARGTRVQSPKREEILRRNSVTHHLLIFFKWKSLKLFSYGPPPLQYRYGHRGAAAHSLESTLLHYSTTASIRRDREKEIWKREREKGSVCVCVLYVNIFSLMSLLWKLS